MHKLNLCAGDVILTQEIAETEIRRLGNKNIHRTTFYDAPEELERFIRDELEKEAGYTSIGKIFKEPLKIGGKVYPLSTKVVVSASYCTAWLVVNADEQADEYTLYAIGQNADARDADFRRYAENLPQELLPSREEYLTVDKVDSSFFFKKAIHLLKNGETKNIKTNI